MVFQETKPITECDTLRNVQIWAGCKIPCQFSIENIVDEAFSEQILEPTDFKSPCLTLPTIVTRLTWFTLVKITQSINGNKILQFAKKGAFTSDLT